jgi:rubrerythrin
MPSHCPKCHAVLEDDSICCAELQHTWKCRSCSKLTTGFAVPYGRCYLCGGELEVVEAYRSQDVEKTRIVEEAVQLELEMYSFYRLAKERTSDEKLREVLEDLYQKEQEHIAELERKYHVHLDRELLEPTADSDERMASWLFEGIDFQEPTTHVHELFVQAIRMERRTRDFFRTRADGLPEGSQKELYRELAAEEEDHVATLLTERDLHPSG